MKRFFYLTLLIAGCAFGQEQLQYGTGGTVYGAENQRISPDRVRELMKDNAQALELYNAGRRKKTWGNVLFYTGIGLAAINLYQGFTAPGPTYNSSTGQFEDEKVTPTLAIVGGVLFVASIPIKIGYPKKIKRSLELYNQGVSSVQRHELDMTVIADSNGVGFRIQF